MPEKTYCRVSKAIRLAQSGEADCILSAAQEILVTRLKHGDALNSLNSPGAVKDYPNPSDKK